MEKVLNQILQKVTDLDTKVSSLDSKVSSLDSKVSSLDSRMGNLEVDVKGIKTEHGTILRSLEENAAISRSKLERMEKDLSDLQEQVEQMG